MHNDLIIPFIFFIVALLYSAVGHGGASGYSAVLAWLGFAAPALKPMILIMNIAVSSITFTRFLIAKQVNFKLLLPLLALSIPLSFIGGKINVSKEFLEKIIGFALLCSSIATFIFDGILAKSTSENEIKTPKKPQIFITGAGFGFLAGLTGIGGGVFLSPLMLHLRWAKIREISGIASGFILFNSISGLIGQIGKPIAWPHNFELWIIAVVAGGLVGSWLGIRRIGVKGLRILLSIIVFSAAIKLLFA